MNDGTSNFWFKNDHQTYGQFMLCRLLTGGLIWDSQQKQNFPLRLKILFANFYAMLSKELEPKELKKLRLAYKYIVLLNLFIKLNIWLNKSLLLGASMV